MLCGNQHPAYIPASTASLGAPESQPQQSTALFLIFASILGPWPSVPESPESGKLFALLEQHLNDANEGV